MARLRFKNRTKAQLGTEFYHHHRLFKVSDGCITVDDKEVENLKIELEGLGYQFDLEMGEKKVQSEPVEVEQQEAAGQTDEPHEEVVEPVKKSSRRSK